MDAGQKWIAIGVIFAGMGVSLGALGAHLFERQFVTVHSEMGTKIVAGEPLPASAKYLRDYQTGVQYQLVHSLAILAVGLMCLTHTTVWLRVAGRAFVIGIALFSGGLYVIALTASYKVALIVPVGGLAFLVGWIAFAIAAFKAKPRTSDREPAQIA